MKQIFKRLSTIALMVCFILCAYSQTQTFKNAKEGVSLEYSSNFKKVAIHNAKHMLLKLESGTITIALSKWNYDMDNSYNIWNEEIIAISRENVTRTGSTLVSLDKRYINTKSGKKKTLVIITNASDENLHVVTYQFLHKGNLVQMVVSNWGKYKKNTQAIYDAFVSGLTLY